MITRLEYGKVKRPMIWYAGVTRIRRAFEPEAIRHLVQLYIGWYWFDVFIYRDIDT